jgi:hypothetical protein
MISGVAETNFDAMQTLRILIKLEDTPEPDMSYLRRLVVATVKRQVAPIAATQDVVETTEEEEPEKEPASGRPATKAKAKG